MTIGSLFSGIGGFDLGFERAGFDIKWQVEIDPWCRAVLAKHWPDVRRYEDVREVMGHAAKLQFQRESSAWTDDARLSSARPISRQRAVSRRVHVLEPVDVICGGFPCQPHSLAGARGGAADERDLWPEFARLIRELRPRWVVAENVPGILSTDAGRFFGQVLSDLAQIGYDAEWDCLPASAFGAPHRRDRVWIVAYPNERCMCGRGTNRGDGRTLSSQGPERLICRSDGGAYVADAVQQRRDPRIEQDGTRDRRGDGESRMESVGVGAARIFTDTNGASLGRFTESRRECGQWESEPDVGRVAHGVPHRVDRLRGLGNAIVPQIAQWIAERIKDAEGLT